MSQSLARHITRRKVQIVLGILWLLDGALQLQWRMFTTQFATNVISPAAQGQPAYVSGPMHLAIRIFLTHPAIFNTFIMLTQLGIGALILDRRTTTYGLIGSVVWGLVVWYIGEGLGGLASGQASLLMGAPGAALLYVVIALGVIPKRSSRSEAKTRPAYWLSIVWAVLWLGGAALQLMSGQNTAASLSVMITGMAAGAPGWLAALDTHVGAFVRDGGDWFVVGLVIAQALIGFLVFWSRRWRAVAVGAGIIISLAFWAVGQGFGQLYSGLATDPSTAPLVILLGIAVLGTGEVITLDLWAAST